MRAIASFLPKLAFLKLTIRLVDLIVVTLAVEFGKRHYPKKT
jgi:hypothetical protein